MRYFLTRRRPAAGRVLLVESGSRRLLDGLLPQASRIWGERAEMHLLTCFGGRPESLPPGSVVYWLGDYAGPGGRKRLYRELAAQRFTILAMICSEEPILFRWKWALAALLPAKVFIVNENGDYFWLDRGHWRSIRAFCLFRAGLAGPGAVRRLGELALFPLTVLYLLLYAATVHIRRALRQAALRFPDENHSG